MTRFLMYITTSVLALAAAIAAHASTATIVGDSQIVQIGSAIVVHAFVRRDDGVPVNDGEVVFVEGSDYIPECFRTPVVNGVASCSRPAPSPGWHRYPLTYWSPISPADGGSALVYVAPSFPLPTSIAFAPASVVASPVHRNDAIVFSATVKGLDNAPADAPLPSGFATFAFDGSDAPGCTHVRVIAAQIPDCVRANMRQGLIDVQVRFEPDDPWGPSAGSKPRLNLRAPIADFDGNYKADILWTHPSGKAALWLMNHDKQVGGSVLFEAGTGWAPLLVGDFDGNEKGDLLFRHSDGRIGAWLMSGTTQVGGAMLVGPGTGWTPTRLADFDGDNRSDILWEHADGRVAIWLMDGVVQKGGGVLLGAGTGWHPKLCADFDGDGKADILWQHDDGSAAIWLMDGAHQRDGARLAGIGPGWSAKFSSLLDGDGKADILWTHVDGRAWLWLMDGISAKAAQVIRPAGSGEVPVAVTGIDVGGHSGIAWQRADGSIKQVAMLGFTEVSTRESFSAGSGYTVVRAVDFGANTSADLLLQHTDGSIILVEDFNFLIQRLTLLGPGTGWTPLAFPE